MQVLVDTFFSFFSFKFRCINKTLKHDYLQTNEDIHRKSFFFLYFIGPTDTDDEKYPEGDTSDAPQRCKTTAISGKAT